MCIRDRNDHLPGNAKHPPSRQLPTQAHPRRARSCEAGGSRGPQRTRARGCPGHHQTAQC
eukprot:980221-Alexandrium_andersonii.AAC.1